MQNKKHTFYTHSGVNMTKHTNMILVQNIETFETLLFCASMDDFDSWLEDTQEWGIVSLDPDADGEYAFVALVAPQDGPDFVMDTVTGEMEPVEDIDPQAEFEAKMDIMMELDMNDVPQSEILAMLNNETPEVAPQPTQKKPRKTRKTKSKAKGAKMSQPKKIRNFEILTSFIEANPGCSRTEVFTDQGLLQSLRTKSQVSLINNGDKTEVKRWNRRLNFLIRESKRQGVDIQIERKGRVAHYTINTAHQLELPFDLKAEARNSAIIGNDVANVEVEAPVVTATRAEEPDNVSLNFEDLLATLDNDNALVTSDDQVAFENAQNMLK